MHRPATASLRPAARAALLCALAVSVAAASGCGWFRSARMYSMSPEQRPLEVPPELDVAAAAGAVATSTGTTSALRSTTGARAAATAGTTAPGLGFNVAMPRDQAYARVGEVLEGVEGLSIASRAQLLGAYDVSYRGGNFLVRVTGVEAGSYVSAVDPRGVSAAGEGATALMAALKAELGGN